MPQEQERETDQKQGGGQQRGYWGRPGGSVHDGRFLKARRSDREDIGDIVRIGREFVRGFRVLRSVGPCVTVFGSARFTEDNRYYQMARDLGAQLARTGFTVMTGGGPGIMEAANRGAQEVGGHSVGANVILPHEQEPNAYLDTWLDFEYFFVRKVMLVKYSYAFVVMPGGFGTMDEIFETATLIQTDKIEDFPIVLMGSDYWSPLIDFMRNTMIPEGTIQAEDVERLHLTDSPEEATLQILRSATAEFGLQWRPRGHREATGPGE